MPIILFMIYHLHIELSEHLMRLKQAIGEMSALQKDRDLKQLDLQNTAS
jgi:hypothetical protein